MLHLGGTVSNSQSFEHFLAEARLDPEFEPLFQAELAAIRMVDQLVAELDKGRAALGLTKQDLAQKLQMNPAQVRRMLSKGGQNPTMKTFLQVAQSMGFELALVKSAPAKI
jgi:DNA-binding phage protein